MCANNNATKNNIWLYHLYFRKLSVFCICSHCIITIIETSNNKRNRWFIDRAQKNSRSIHASYLWRLKKQRWLLIHAEAHALHVWKTTWIAGRLTWRCWENTSQLGCRGQSSVLFLVLSRKIHTGFLYIDKLCIWTLSQDEEELEHLMTYTGYKHMLAHTKDLYNLNRDQ